SVHWAKHIHQQYLLIQMPKVLFEKAAHNKIAIIVEARLAHRPPAALLARAVPIGQQQRDKLQHLRCNITTGLEKACGLVARQASLTATTQQELPPLLGQLSQLA